MALDIPFKGSCAEHRVKTVINDIILCPVAYFKFQTSVFKAFCKARYKNIHNAFHIFLGKRFVEHDFVKPVKEFGAETALQQRLNALFCLFGDFAVFVNTVKQKL